MLLPYYVVYILNVKFQMRQMTNFKQYGFNNLYEFLFSGFRTNVQGVFQYFFLFLFRKQIYAHLVYYFDADAFCMF